MNTANPWRFNFGLLTSALLGSLLLASCGSAQVSNSESAPSDQTANSSTGTAMENAPAAAPIAQTTSTEGEATPPSSEIPQAQPQLIKTAELVITVDSVETSIAAATAIARRQQGDLLNLQDQIPPDGYSHHTASLQIRVPQAKLDTTLAELSQIGEVQRQSLTAEDVSNQLVDYQARLRNLRRSEETVLKIMDRSGNVAEVLQVAQELNNIRSSIEQLDAQLNDLRNRVAYSTISLSLEESITSVPPQRSVPIQLQETWAGATRSLSEVTVDLLQLGIWLLVYSPYWLLAIGLGTLGYRRLRRSNSGRSADRSTVQ